LSSKEKKKITDMLIA